MNRNTMHFWRDNRGVKENEFKALLNTEAVITSLQSHTL